MQIVLSSLIGGMLDEQLINGNSEADVIDAGTVISLGDGIARIYG